MAMVGVESSGLVFGQRPLAAVLRSSNAPGELLQWLCYDDITINIVLELLLLFTDDYKVTFIISTSACGT